MVISFIGNSCIKKECQINGSSYEFVLPFTLSPAQEIYHIGDTITISSEVKNPVFERKTGNYYTLDDFKFYLVNDIYKMDTSASGYFSMEYFDLIIDKVSYYNLYKFSDGSNHLQLQYYYLNNKYILNYKLVLKKHGLYLFKLWSDINYRNGDQWFEGKCDNIENHAVVFMNGRSDNNINLIDDAYNADYHIFKSNRELVYLDAGGYCFKVIE